MPCCCLNILNLCDKPVCGVLTLDVAAGGLPSGAESGDLNNYTLVLDYLAITITLTEEQTEGENIHFDISGLNENFQYTGQVFDSSGNVVSTTVDEVVYDCIKFKTVVNVAV